MTNRIIILLSFMVLAACQPAKTDHFKANPLISDYAAAFNARNLGAMEALMHPNIQWLSINGAEISIVTDGKQALVDELTGYFASKPTSASALANWTQSGKYIGVTETSSWHGKDGQTKSQSSLSIYELEDGLIRRVWYYPEQK